MSALTYVIIAGVFVAVLALLKLLLPLVMGVGGETGTSALRIERDARNACGEVLSRGSGSSGRT